MFGCAYLKVRSIAQVQFLGCVVACIICMCSRSEQPCVCISALFSDLQWGRGGCSAVFCFCFDRMVALLPFEIDELH